VTVRATDKGNEIRNVKISMEFYKELLRLKNKSSSDKVFDISEDGIQRMMNYLVKEMKLENRNIVFHSFRKAGVSFSFRISNDILQAKKAAGHSSLNNTMLYLGEQNYGLLGAVSSKGKINDNLYKNVSHEELVTAIS